ncbi:hypothetical protein C8F04DRAFT_1288964 [Mycena alexandri]|uniref:Uncharacterized protein n=1 Tax=Mycena alexandri TaxID=1745969 RepID=A0AAD6SP02_9AGAR|nr:hypothetical protein C8F04DRAFT_1288964 [Mycena alexandri]
MLGRAHNVNRYVSCFEDLDGDFAFHGRPSPRRGSNTAYGTMSVTRVLLRLGRTRPWTAKTGMEAICRSSAFSVTTTSTSNYINVGNEMTDDESADWSALEAPNTPGYASLFFTHQPPTPTPNRRLHKSRPPPKSASPSDVRAGSTATTSQGPDPSVRRRCPPRRSQTPMPTPMPTPTPAGTPHTRHLSVRSVHSLPRFARGLGKSPKKAEPPGGWVWIDVKERDEFAPTPSSHILAAASRRDYGDTVTTRVRRVAISN